MHLEAAYLENWLVVGASLHLEVGAGHLLGTFLATWWQVAEAGS
jgi:hypothetical protein